MRVAAKTIGTFSLWTSDGREITPRGQKERGLLATLCLAEERRRSRRWLEAILWSEADVDQASANLRQALLRLRRGLGVDAALIVATRDEVSFAPGALSVDFEDDPAGARAALDAGRELFEGLDVREEGFEDWLREQRGGLPARLGRMTAKRPARRPPTLVLTQGETFLRGEALLARACLDRVTTLLSDFAFVEVWSPEGVQASLGPPDRGLRLQVDVSDVGGRTHVLARLRAGLGGRVLWTRQVALDAPSEAALGLVALDALVYDAAESAYRAIPEAVAGGEAEVEAEALILNGVRDLFSFDPARLARAEALFRQAGEVAPSARVLAWRAAQKSFLAVERSTGDVAAVRAEASDLATRALQAGEPTALVLALVSHVRLTVDGDVASGGMLARDAMALTPGNPFAAISLAAALSRQGQPEAARALAARGRDAAQFSPLRHWFDSACCLAEIAAGDFDAAILSAEAAFARAPTFRPPLRHLYALYLKRGQIENAVRIADALRRLEPDFSLRRVREDPTFPGSTLRLARLSDQEDVIPA
jgi:DNA-binding SARP family transcriptional activator